MRNCAIIAQFYFAILFVLILPLDGSHSKGTEINSHVCSDKLQGLFQYDYVMRTTIQKAMAESDDLMELLAKFGLLEDLDQPFWDPKMGSSALFHPLNQYMLLTQFANIWPRFDRVLSAITKNLTSEKIWDALYGNKSPQFVPYTVFVPIINDIRKLKVSQKVLKKVATSILRLQEVYQLSGLEMSKGNIRNHAGLRMLSNAEVGFLYDVALERNDSCRAIAWMKVHAQRLADSFNFFERPLNVSMRTADLEKCTTHTCFITCQPVGSSAELVTQYKSLCQTPTTYLFTNRKLKCFFWRPQPEFIWAPLKYELLYEHPRVFLIRDFISEKQAKEVWDLAYSKLKDSKIILSNGEEDIDDWRSGAHAWLRDADSEFIDGLSQYVGRVVRKNMSTTDDWQVGNYGVGGHYGYHTDYFNANYLKQAWTTPLGYGNRLMTFMVYLSDVEEGGFTAFPRLGLSVKPVLGTAIAWYNLRSDGTTNDKTLHGGCPVLMGNKKIANKWIYEGAQTFLYPCTENNRRYADKEKQPTAKK